MPKAVEDCRGARSDRADASLGIDFADEADPAERRKVEVKPVAEKVEDAVLQIAA